MTFTPQLACLPIQGPEKPGTIMRKVEHLHLYL